MSDNSFKDRVRRERDELRIKVSRLREFNEGVVYESLSSYEQVRLGGQLHHMTCYLDLLESRIQHFDD